tara:strand:+ start:300 stop:440 length:141 start_codon:yes stop_codon:yes gene_type:complete
MSENNNDIFELNEAINDENLFKRVPVAVFESPIWLNDKSLVEKRLL